MSAVKPILPRLFDDCEKLNIPALEWAGRVEDGCYYGYEFIGKRDALIATGLAQHHMLAVGISGKKHGSGYRVQILANDRCRLEIYVAPPDIESVIRKAKTIKPSALPVPVVAQHDPLSSSLQKVGALINRYPSKLRTSLYSGLCASGGNGWQLVESFPWLAVRIFVVEDNVGNAARQLVQRGAKQRDIAEAVNVPMCFKRFVPRSTERLMDLADLLSRHPDVVSHHCPEKEKKQFTWLSFIAKAYESGNEDFAIWAGIHWESLSDEPYAHWGRHAVGNLNDWVRDCSIEQVSRNIEDEDVEKIYQAMLTTSRLLKIALKMA